LLATNQQAKAQQQQEQAASTMSAAEAMRQTTLTQCFDPPVVADAAAPAASAASAGYRVIDIDGQQYLLNDTTNHLLLVPAQKNKAAAPEQKVSERAQSCSPKDLARDSFGSGNESAPSTPSSSRHITPSVTKKKKEAPAAAASTTSTATTRSSNIVLSENCGSDDEIIYVAQRRKKRKTAPRLAASPLSEVEVIEQVEVESQDLPETGHFGDYARVKDDSDVDSGSVGGDSVNLLSD
jgi:hypothetical protein